MRTVSTYLVVVPGKVGEALLCLPGEDNVYPCFTDEKRAADWAKSAGAKDWRVVQMRVAMNLTAGSVAP
jgi:hypothetical protein